MNLEPVVFTEEYEILKELDYITFYAETLKGRRFPCCIQYRALEEFFCKSDDESVFDCFLKEKDTIQNIARGLIINNDFNNEGVYHIGTDECIKYENFL